MFIYQVFNSGYHNMYSEATPLAKVTIKLLKNLLWTVEEGLSYEDKSIFIEEKVLLVTTTLLDALRIPSPMISRVTCVAVLCTLQTIADFLESYPINQPNFKVDFTKFMIISLLNNRITKFLSKNDINNLRMFFRTLYSPILCR